MKVSLSSANRNWISIIFKIIGVQNLMGILLFCALPVAAQPLNRPWQDFSDGDEPPYFPRSSANVPPANYLDLPFLSPDASVNKFLQSMEDHGVKPFVKYWGDFLANPVGGVDQQADWYQLLVFGGKFDLEKLIGWKGGEFMISAADTAGDDLTNDVGTFFTPSQAVSARGFVLYLLYLSQKFADGKVELRAGRMTAGSMFASLPIMGLPVSGAVNGNPISLFYNASGFHATGKATWAAAAKVKPTDNTYVQTGIFQVNSNRMNAHWFNGVDFSFRRGDGILLMAETGWTPTFARGEASSGLGKDAFHRQPEFAGLPGAYEFGAYWQNYPMPVIGNSANTIQNQYGFYWQGQQMLWRSRTNADHNFSIWAGVTYSPQTQIAPMPVMGYGGVAWSGPIPGRDKDQALINIYIGGYSNYLSQQNLALSRGGNTVETVLEASYIFQLTKQIQFQPDLQYFIQPSGMKSIPNALVLGFQVSFVF